MRPPKGFALYFGAAEHIFTKRLLYIVLLDEHGLAASILSNERYGSGPISMSTAAGEALLLLGAGHCCIPLLLLRSNSSSAFRRFVFLARTPVLTQFPVQQTTPPGAV
jgi:hypothetical protein